MSPRKTPAYWLFLASLALSLVVAWELLLPLSVGAVLAYVSERPIDALARRFHKEGSVAWRWVFAIGFVVAAFLVALVPLTLAVWTAVRDVAHFAQALDWDAVGRRVQDAIETMSAWARAHGVEIGGAELSQRVRAVASAQAASVGRLLGAAIGATPAALFHAFVTVIAWVFLAVDGPAARDRVLVRLIPWEREREILRSIAAEVIHSVIVANVLVSAIQGLLASIALLALGVPRAFVWGVLTFFLSFVPVVGTTPVTIGATIYLVAHGRPGAAVVMALIGVAVATIDNVLRPFFMKSSVDLSFLWILVALIGGASIFGLPGVILGPLAFSLFVTALHALEAIEEEEAAVARGEEPPRSTRTSLIPTSRKRA